MSHFPLLEQDTLAQFHHADLTKVFLYFNQNLRHKRPSRWRKSKTWRSPSSAQIHQKYTYMWKNSYRTPTERWQKNSDLPKGKYMGRAKEKRKNRDKRIGTGPAPLGESCEG